MKKSSLEKMVFFTLGLLIVTIWYLYGAPYSLNPLHGFSRFLLDVGIFTLATVSFFRLYGTKIGLFYLLLVLLDLLVVYEIFSNI